MHILYFHQHFSTPNGRTGIRSYEMAKALIDKGHCVTIVCGSYAQGETGLSGQFIKGKRQGDVDGIKVIEFDLGYSNHLSFFNRLSIFLKFALGSILIVWRVPADIIFATSTPLTIGITGIFAKWIMRKVFVFEVRDLWPELPKSMGIIKNPIILSLMYFLEWAIYKSADRVVALSPGMVDGIIARGINESKVAMIPNGCDFGIFDFNVSTIKSKMLPKKNLVAIYAGTHGQANGLDILLEAAVILKAAGRNNISIVLVGDGKKKDLLIEKSKKLKLNNIHFLDPVSKSKLSKLFCSCDIGLQILDNVPAFYYGTSPNKFFDYLSAGLPVINNYPGWVAELINDYNFGFAVPPDNPKAIANALCSAQDNRKDLKIFSTNARNLGRKHFDRKILSQSWINWVLFSEK
jgi:glycosyltransferase involved in cell wall biosynthesis